MPCSTSAVCSSPGSAPGSSSPSPTSRHAGSRHTKNDAIQALFMTPLSRRDLRLVERSAARSSVKGESLRAFGSWLRRGSGRLGALAPHLNPRAQIIIEDLVQLHAKRFRALLV